jgi:hypothetical protein
MDIAVILIIIAIIVNGWIAIDILRYGMQYLGISVYELFAIIVFIVFPLAILILIAKAIALLIREIVGKRDPKT